MTIVEQRDAQVLALYRLRQASPSLHMIEPYQEFLTLEQQILDAITSLESQLPPGYHPWPCLEDQLPGV